MCFVFAVKQESTPSSPSSTGLKVNLPATPKSSNGDKGEDSADQTMVSESAQGEDNKDERMETDATRQEMEVDRQPEEKHFVLAPTPAQLGKAPLQRRLAGSCSQDSTKDLSPTELPVTSSASFSGMFAASVTAASNSVVGSMEEPMPTSANAKKKQFFKKAKNDDMDT